MPCAISARSKLHGSGSISIHLRYSIAYRVAVAVITDTDITDIIGFLYRA